MPINVFYDIYWEKVNQIFENLFRKIWKLSVLVYEYDFYNLPNISCWLYAMNMSPSVRTFYHNVCIQMVSLQCEFFHVPDYYDVCVLPNFEKCQKRKKNTLLMIEVCKYCTQRKILNEIHNVWCSIVHKKNVKSIFLL